MSKVIIHDITTGIPYNNAPAGAYCKILEAAYPELVGLVCRKPFQTNQLVTIFGATMGSTDPTLGIKTVQVLQPGSSFTVFV